MEKEIKSHLEQITIESLIEWREDAFSAMTSCPNQRGNQVFLGVTMKGKFSAREAGKRYDFDDADAAIEKYKELLLAL